MGAFDFMNAVANTAETITALQRENAVLRGQLAAIAKEMGYDSSILNAPCDALLHNIRDTIANGKRAFEEWAALREVLFQLREPIAKLASQVICPTDNTFSRMVKQIDTAVNEGSRITRPQYGPQLNLHYTDASDLVVLHHLPMSDGYSVRVVGNPDNASYEWVIERGGKLFHSDCGYGDSDIALRDGLIAMHGLPNDNSPSRRTQTA